jgi:acyl carrier protein
VISNRKADPVWRKPSLSDQVTSILSDYMKDRGLPVPDRKVDLDEGLASFGLDSLDGVAIVAELERHFNLALDTNQAARAQRLRDLVALVARAQEHFQRR